MNNGRKKKEKEKKKISYCGDKLVLLFGNADVVFVIVVF